MNCEGPCGKRLQGRAYMQEFKVIIILGTTMVVTTEIRMLCTECAK